jgi:hypothetical protein
MKDKSAMPPRKNPITNPNGDKPVTERKRRGGLTNSARFDKPEVTTSPIETIVDKASNVVQSVSGTAQSVGNATRAISNGVKGVQRSFSGSSPMVTADHKEALTLANTMSSQFGIQDIELTELLGTDPYAADSSAPEMTSSEANATKLRIQRQNNSIEVRHEKVKQGRKVVALAIEQRRLVGDMVDFATAGVEVASKVVKHEIANVRFQTEQSKLEQSEELLIQQQVATEGSINLTEGIRQEWVLKFDRQQAKNENLRLEVEGAIRENDVKRQELEAKLLEGVA